MSKTISAAALGGSSPSRHADEQDSAKDISQARREWLAANQQAMNDWNDYVARHGIPLAAYRQF